LPAAAVLTALGVVYGDIGTSTLYGLKQAVDAGGAPTPETVIGTVSLIFWALLLIVGLKYAILGGLEKIPVRRNAPQCQPPSGIFRSSARPGRGGWPRSRNIVLSTVSEIVDLLDHSHEVAEKRRNSRSIEVGYGWQERSGE
jgi:hypothetical protein